MTSMLQDLKIRGARDKQDNICKNRSCYSKLGKTVYHVVDDAKKKNDIYCIRCGNRIINGELKV